MAESENSQLDFELHDGGSPGKATFITAFEAARVGDFEELCQRFYAESRFSKHTTYSTAATCRYAMQFVRGGTSRRGWLAMHMGRPIGFLLARLSTPWWSDTLVAYEQGYYVVPEARGCGAGRMLLEAFEAWGAEMEAAYCQVAVTSGVGEGAVELFLGGQGYRYAGAAFEKEV